MKNLNKTSLFFLIMMIAVICMIAAVSVIQPLKVSPPAIPTELAQSELVQRSAAETQRVHSIALTAVVIICPGTLFIIGAMYLAYSAGRRKDNKEYAQITKKDHNYRWN